MNRIAMLDRKGMTILVAALLGAFAAAQSTSLPPICFSFNQNGPAGAQSAPGYPISGPGDFTVWFSAPMSTTIEALDLPMAFSWGGPATSADIHVAPALGVPPVAPSLGTFLPTDLGGWIPFVTTTPVPVTGGGTYAVVLRAFPYPPGSTTWCSGLQYDPAATQTLPYQFTGTSCPPTTLPPSGMIGFMCRFRGTACGAGPLASATAVGAPCGLTVTGNTLYSSYPPGLGLNWPVSLWSGSGAVYLFFALGTNAAGSPIVPGSFCLHYLDAPSLTTLFAAGLEPLAQAAPPTNQVVDWWFQLPSSPALAGAVFGLQALAVSPAGTIPLGPGVSAYTSNALSVTLGYWYP